MGRPYEFDIEETLGKAMELFWQKGYHATSVEELVQTMGINRGSIYNTYGDKHSLFLKALDHYGKNETSRMLKTLYDGPSPTRNIINFFTRLKTTNNQWNEKGCLICNTAVELAPHDPKARELVSRFLERIRAAFHETLENAVEMGEIEPGTDTRALSHFMANNTMGLLVLRKSGATPEQLENIVNVVVTNLK